MHNPPPCLACLFRPWRRWRRRSIRSRTFCTLPHSSPSRLARTEKSCARHFMSNFIFYLISFLCLRRWRRRFAQSRTFCTASGPHFTVGSAFVSYDARPYLTFSEPQAPSLCHRQRSLSVPRLRRWRRRCLWINESAENDRRPFALRSSLVQAFLEHKDLVGNGSANRNSTPSAVKQKREYPPQE